MEEFYLKISGKVNIPQRLEIGHNYHVILNGSITKEERADNNDGSFLVTWKFEPVQVEVLTPKGETIKAKDKRRISQKIRGALYFCWKESNTQMDEEEFYEQNGLKIIKYMPEVLELLKKYD